MNILYTFYFILKTNYSDVKQSIACTRNKGYKKYRLILDMLYSSLLYGSSFVDYFNFQFYRKTKKERKKYATMGIMYKFHRKMNHKESLSFVDDKKEFFRNYAQFCNPAFLFKKEQKNEIESFFSERIGEKVVVKDTNSTGGKGVRIKSITKNNDELFLDTEKVTDFMNVFFETNEIFYVEDYIKQHHAITKIAPTAVNTLRIITLINDKNKVEIIGTVFRISVNSPIDNYSAGNMAAEVNLKTGMVITGGIRKRSSCDKYHEIHPITKEQVKGFTIPYWKETIELSKKSAMLSPRVRTIGWDVAITEKGPILIEGNSQWNKDTWQIPAGFGKLNIIKKYL